MNRIDFTRIYGRGYNSFRDEFELVISPGKHLVIGEQLSASSANSNGTGKSSLFDNIPWTIFKRYLRGVNPSYDGKGNCMTGLECRVGDREYAFERTFKDGPKKQNGSRILINGEDVSPRIGTGVDEEILKVIDIPYDLFVSCCVVLQGIPINFSQFTPTIRKGIIEGALKFPWDQYRKKFNTKIATNSTELVQVQADFKKSNESMINLNAQLEASKSSNEDKVTEAVAKLNEIMEEMSKAKQKLAHLNDQRKKTFNADAESDLQQSITTMSTSLGVMFAKVSELETIVNDKVCPTCNAPYPEAQISEAVQQLSMFKDKVKRLGEQKQVIEERLRDLVEANQGVNDQTAAVKQLRESHSSWTDYKTKMSDSSSSDLSEQQTKLTELTISVNAFNQSLEGLQRDAENLTYIDSLLLPSSPFRTSVLSKYLDQITTIIRQITPLIFEDVQISLCVDKKATGVEIEIIRGKKKIEYKSLSGGEKRRLDIVIIFAFQRFLMEASGINTNLVVFDEIFEGLDQKGIQSVMSCMDMLFPEDMAVYVITHDDSFKSQFDSIVKVVKENGVSRLQA